MATTTKQIADLLGAEADNLLNYQTPDVKKDLFHLPGPDFVDRVLAASDRRAQVLRNFQQFISHGRLAGSGYVSILPVVQGVEHSAGARFGKNSIYVAIEM